MANRLCPICGEDYADWATNCATCRVGLVDPGAVEDLRQLPDDERVVYELGEWTLDQHTEVAVALTEAGIPHSWDGDELIVHVDHEAAVDRLLEPIDAAGAPSAVELPEGSLTEYDMAEWPDNERELVTTRLTEAAVPHRWEGTLLLVPVAEEAVVDDILDDIEEGGDAAALDDDGAETPFEVLESMFLAAGRLRHNFTDGDGIIRLAAAYESADPDRPPFGVDLAAWRRIMETADEVADGVSGGDGNASGGGAGDVGGPTVEDVQAAAERLHAMLRQYI